MTAEKKEEPPYIHIGLCGSALVGKTCMVAAFIDGVFPEFPGRTFCANFSPLKQIGGRTVRVIFLDTPGDDEYARYRPLCFTGSSVVLICFNVTDRTSFDACRSKWVPEVRAAAPVVPLVLVGLKTDLRTGAVTDVPETEAQEFASEIRSRFVQCSAKLFEGLDAVFEETVRAALEPARTAGEKKTCEIS